MTLDRLTHIAIPEGNQWEILLIDNNSQDNTKEVVESFKDRLPIRYALESNLGQCYARNHAISIAKGDYILWTDDDVLVSRDWVNRYIDAFGTYEYCAFAGGTIDPLFSITPPSWINRHIDLLQGPFAIRQLGGETRPLATTEMIFGANMAFRTEVLRKYLFNVELGLKGNGAVRGDETELVNRLRNQKHHGIWVGNAVVEHYIPRERLTTSYIRKFFRGYGEQARMEEISNPYPKMFGYPRWAVKQLLVSSGMELALRVTRSRKWLESLQNAAVMEGYLSTYKVRK
jgi:glycosyltransferase involved in cell wall biosynthesis